MASRKILITGADGQLGAEFCRQLGDRAIGLNRAQLDLLDGAAVQRTIRLLHPTAIINTAAYTAVDRAEQEPEACEAVNAYGVGSLATVCREFDLPLVQISTDYVFGADCQRCIPYRETDWPGPINVYGATKFRGEQTARVWQKHFVVRTCGLYGRRIKPMQSNFVDTMLRLGRERNRLRVVGDQTCTPTYTADLVPAVMSLLSGNAYGIYQVVNGGETTWFDFANEIFRLSGMQVAVDRISTAEYNARAARPSYSVLDTSKYHAIGGPVMRDWHDALAAYLRTVQT